MGSKVVSLIRPGCTLAQHDVFARAVRTQGKGDKPSKLAPLSERPLLLDNISSQIVEASFPFKLDCRRAVVDALVKVTKILRRGHKRAAQYTSQYLARMLVWHWLLQSISKHPESMCLTEWERHAYSRNCF